MTEIITLKNAELTFPSYETYKEKCLVLAEEIRTLEVTEENVKIVKKDLADVRKFTKALDDRRKELKKEILKPFELIEKQVKELINIVDEADRDVRSQVKLLEEVERDAKQTAIKELWDKRISHYDIESYIPDAFDKWLLPYYLNKTTSMKAVETAMVEWLQMVQKEINAILGMQDSMDIMVDYASTLDFAESVNRHQLRNDYKNHVSAVEHEDDEEENAIFKIEGLANIELVERLLKDYNIKYIKY